MNKKERLEEQERKEKELDIYHNTDSIYLIDAEADIEIMNL